MASTKSHTAENSLHRTFHALEQDWDSYKQSAPRHRRSCSAALSGDTDFSRLLCSSPKKPIVSLQRRSEPSSPSDGPHPRAISTIGIRGRKLFGELEKARDDDDDGLVFRGTEEICSAESSALIQGSSTTCSCCLSLPSSVVGYRAGFGFSSSESESLFSLEERVRVSGGGGKWTVRMLCWGVIVGVVVLLALSVMSSTLIEFGVGENGEHVVPT